MDIRTEEELAGGNAVSSEILNSAWRVRLGLDSIPEIGPEEAGRNLARIAAGFDLTLFAHYYTDTAGHRRSMEEAVGALQRLDAFLAGLLPLLPPDLTLVLASDHGNLEDISQGHTLNPTFNLLRGPGAREMAGRMSRITDLAGVVLDRLVAEA